MAVISLLFILATLLGSDAALARPNKSTPTPTPTLTDRDGDGVSDATEVAQGSDPADARFFLAARYVDPKSVGGTCSDAFGADAAKSPATPWCSFQRSAVAAPSGSTVRVRAGTHSPSIVRLVRTGWMRFVPNPGEAPVLAGVTFDDARFVQLRGFEITGADRRVWISGGSSDLEISDNNIHDVRTGFYLRDGGQRITLRNNIVRNAIWANLNVKDGYGLSMVSGGWTDLTIANNTFSRANGDGLQLGGATRLKVTNNIIEDVAVYDGNDDHADAIQISGSITDAVIARNVIRRSSKGMIVGSSVLRARDGLTVENNVIYDITGNCLNIYDTQRLVIRHNTCWNTGYGVWLRDESISPTHTTGARVYNNLLGPVTRYSASLDIQIRGFADWGTENNNLLAQRASSQTYFSPSDITPTSQQLLTLVRDAAAGDLRPSLGSVVIDKGTGLDIPATDAAGAPRLSGAAPDMGAYESF